MQTRVRDNPPRRLLDRFREHPIMAGMPRLVPAIKAYGGLRVSDPLLSRTGETLGRIGSLEVRLAHRAAEIRKAQRLRFDVFYQEMSAVADAATLIARRDVDPYDAMCDHLLVLDHGCCPNRKGPAVVGTYRLLRQEIAERCGGFYSAGEFDIGPLIKRHRGLRFLELGRSCVLPAYRNKRTVELLWHGIWTYVLRHKVDVMIGCASLEGTEPNALALPLAFLHHYARAPEEWQVRALPQRYRPLNRLPKEAVDPKAALHLLPPLIKGYLRLGAFVGDGAVIDYQFGTTDIIVVLPVAAINLRYIDHFGAGAERHAA
jgi:putative hemolysin